MRIAVVGAGVSGSYLGHMLHKRGDDVEIFESSRKENQWAVCAWGASRNMLAKFSNRAGLDFDNYIFHVGKTLDDGSSEPRQGILGFERLGNL